MEQNLKDRQPLKPLADFLTLRSLAELLGYRSTKSVRRWASREGLELQKCGGRTGLFRRKYERWLTWRQSR